MEEAEWGKKGTAFDSFPIPIPLLPALSSRPIFLAARMGKAPSTDLIKLRLAEERLLRRLGVAQSKSSWLGSQSFSQTFAGRF